MPQSVHQNPLIEPQQNPDLSVNPPIDPSLPPSIDRPSSSQVPSTSLVILEDCSSDDDDGERPQSAPPVSQLPKGKFSSLSDTETEPLVSDRQQLLHDLRMFGASLAHRFPLNSAAPWSVPKTRKKYQKRYYGQSAMITRSQAHPIKILMIRGLIWNIRGVGNNASIRRLKRLSRMYNFAFVVLIEPLLSVDKGPEVTRRLGFSFFIAN